VTTRRRAAVNAFEANTRRMVRTWAADRETGMRNVRCTSSRIRVRGILNSGGVGQRPNIDITPRTSRRVRREPAAR
jgi:hypothetical protein